MYLRYKSGRKRNRIARPLKIVNEWQVKIPLCIADMNLGGCHTRKVLEAVLRVVRSDEFSKNGDEIEDSQDHHGNLSQLVPAELPPDQLPLSGPVK